MELFETLDESLNLFFSNQTAERFLRLKKSFAFEREALEKTQESLKAHISYISSHNEFSTTGMPKTLYDKWQRYQRKKSFHIRNNRLNKKVYSKIM